MTKAEPAPKGEKTVLCRIKRDRWDESGVRQYEGTHIEAGVEEAMDGIEAGTLERVKG